MISRSYDLVVTKCDLVVTRLYLVVTRYDLVNYEIVSCNYEIAFRNYEIVKAYYVAHTGFRNIAICSLKDVLKSFKEFNKISSDFRGKEIVNMTRSQCRDT